jgi:HSP20 family molecular chaperone IbpA
MRKRNGRNGGRGLRLRDGSCGQLIPRTFHEEFDNVLDAFPEPFRRQFRGMVRDVCDDMHGFFFDRIGSAIGQSDLVSVFGGGYPRLDLIDHDDRIEIEATVPGLKREDVSIKVDGDVLTIEGNKNPEVEAVRDRILVGEIRRSSFRRSIKLKDDAFNLEGISARMEDGLLKVSIPKVVPEQREDNGRVIDIQ